MELAERPRERRAKSTLYLSEYIFGAARLACRLSGELLFSLSNCIANIPQPVILDVFETIFSENRSPSPDRFPGAGSFGIML
jgi:hypothetical protein